MTSSEILIGMPDDERQLLELVARSRAGHGPAFGELTRRLWSRLTAWGLRFSGDADEAEDIAQVVLMRLHDHADAFEGRSRLTSWLFRITRNVAIDRRKRERHRAALLEAQGPLSEAATSAHPSDAFDARAIAELVTVYAKDLTPRQREIFDLVDLQGITVAEIAARLGLEQVTVRVLLSRARKTIRLRILEAHPRLLAEYSE